MKPSQAQIEAFHADGFLFLPEVFSAEKVAVLKREAEAIYATDRKEVWRERPGAPRTAFAAHTYNEAFRLLGARTPTREDWIAQRDFSPITPVPDDALLKLARPVETA